MKLSLNLLKQFTPLDKSAEEIADRITLSLTEVETMEEKGSDTIVEIENKALTHRPDCFSHLGIAREIAAYFNTKCNDPLHELSKQKPTPEKDQKPLTVTVDAKEFIPRYTTIVLTGIHVKPSPKWLSEALEHIGIRSINNVVDITNYVMIELGQPLHAYDYDKVEGNAIVVRLATKDEKLQTLDGTVRSLTNSMIVIADKTKPLLLGGVMGGKDSEVTEKTTTIILEAATFNAITTRQTAKTVGLRTEGSTRYEKNLDPNLTYPALVRTVNLLQEIAGAQIASEVIDIQNEKREEKTIVVSSDWINRFLGTDISTRGMAELLTRFGFSTTTNKTALTISIPTYRSDLSMDADIAEEIARVYGYDNIPTTLPSQTDFTPQKNMDLYWRDKIRLHLTGMGFFETVSNPFIGMDLIKKAMLQNEEHLQLRNPLANDHEYMRRNLLPQLLQNVKNNVPVTNKMRLYEINKLFVPIEKKQPREPFYLTGVTLGDDYRTVKGFVEALFDELGITNYSFAKYPRKDEERCGFFDSLYHPNKTAQIYNSESETEIWGTIGYIHPTVQKNFGIEGDLISFDIPLEMLVKYAVLTKQYKPISAYPPLIEDITLDIKGNKTIGEVIEKMKKTSTLITNIELVDMFNNKYTFRITFQDQTKNLTEKEVAPIKEKIIAEVA